MQALEEAVAEANTQKEQADKALAIVFFVDPGEAGQTLESSFSAVWMPNFAIEASIQSSRQDSEKHILTTGQVPFLS